MTRIPYLIARLDENTSPRLTINGERVEEETAGTGYFLPEGTPHGVLPGNPGDGDRYSLVIWTKRAAWVAARLNKQAYQMK